MWVRWTWKALEMATKGEGDGIRKGRRSHEKAKEMASGMQWRWNPKAKEVNGNKDVRCVAERDNSRCGGWRDGK